jgi:hypothetical protein
MISSSDVVTTILEMNRRLQEATRLHDVETVRALIPDDFSLITSRGRYLDAAGLLAEIGDKRVTWYDNDTEQASVRAYGEDCAIITATLHERYRANGIMFDHRLAFTDTWVLIGGSWKYVAGHASMLTPKS